MQLEELINLVSRLPPAKQQEVLDFAAFLERRYSGGHQASTVSWTDHEFKAMSVEQAMRDIADEPGLYSEDDIRERWQ